MTRMMSPILALAIALLPSFFSSGRTRTATMSDDDDVLGTYYNVTLQHGGQVHGEVGCMVGMSWRGWASVGGGGREMARAGTGEKKEADSGCGRANVLYVNSANVIMSTV
eukprot:352257-Chlamydomonas_euryale.AAC.2